MVRILKVQLGNRTMVFLSLKRREDFTGWPWRQGQTGSRNDQSDTSLACEFREE
ncbi:hypothetical protein [Pseudomonas phage PseuP_224]|nr:hypothetical protein [Pseudomonas phage PseuP_224]